MRRADRLAAIAIGALALGGCMKIYPDPELPDVVAEWFDGDCREGTGNVVLALLGVDDPTSRTDLAVPCGDQEVTFVDLARERYHLDAMLLDDSGQAFSNSAADIDLRDGLDERAFLFFGGLANVRVAWTFDGGATCASLAVDSVVIEFSMAGMPPMFGFGVPCPASPFLGSGPPGTYTARARALVGDTTVAISPESAPVTIAFQTLADVGTLTMSSCAPTCP